MNDKGKTQLAKIGIYLIEKMRFYEMAQASTPMDWSDDLDYYRDGVFFLNDFVLKEFPKESNT